MDLPPAVAAVLDTDGPAAWSPDGRHWTGNADWRARGFGEVSAVSTRGGLVSITHAGGTWRGDGLARELAGGTCVLLAPESLRETRVLLHEARNLAMVLAGAVDDLQVSGAEPELVDDLGMAAEQLLALCAAGGFETGEDRCGVGGTVEATTRLAGGTGLSVDLDADPLLAHVCVPMRRGALASVLLNLVGNAAEARRGAEDDELVLRTRLDGGARVRIEVLDRGVGLPPAVEARLGRPGWSRAGVDHSGVGLAQVRRLVIGAGGDFHIGSRPGGGVCARIRLPALAADERRTHPRYPARAGTNVELLADGRVSQAMLLDWSLGGVRVRVRAPGVAAGAARYALRGAGADIDHIALAPVRQGPDGERCFRFGSSLPLSAIEWLSDPARAVPA